MNSHKLLSWAGGIVGGRWTYKQYLNLPDHSYLDAYLNIELKSYEYLMTWFEDIDTTVDFYTTTMVAPLTYKLEWYTSAALSSLHIKTDDGFYTQIAEYQGYNIKDPTEIVISNAVYENEVPSFKVISYHRGSEWGP